MPEEQLHKVCPRHGPTEDGVVSKKKSVLAGAYYPKSANPGTGLLSTGTVGVQVGGGGRATARKTSDGSANGMELGRRLEPVYGLDKVRICGYFMLHFTHTPREVRILFKISERKQQTKYCKSSCL
jgi:hypothetical protein